MKLQILWGIVFMLLNNKKVTAKQIINRFEISRSTVFRYIDALTLANVPISVDRGRNGGFYIADEYKFKYGYFTDEEIKILTSLISKIENEGNNFDDTEKLKYTILIEKLQALRKNND